MDSRWNVFGSEVRTKQVYKGAMVSAGAANTVLAAISLLAIACTKPVGESSARPNSGIESVQDANVQGAKMQDAGIKDASYSDAAEARGRCGGAGEPLCAMQVSMRALGLALEKKDWFALAEGLDRLAKEPAVVASATQSSERYPNWISIARDTREAARSAEEDAVKAGCRSCHEQYKTAWIAGDRGFGSDFLRNADVDDAGASRKAAGVSSLANGRAP